MPLPPHGKGNVSKFFKLKWFKSNAFKENQEFGNLTLIKSTLESYSELHQFPKLLVEIFLTVENVIFEGCGGVYFNQAYIHTPILETFAKCFSKLPVGQTFEVWKLFTEVYFKYANNKDFAYSTHAGAFIVGQLFSVFLLHNTLFEDTVFPIAHDKIRIYLEQNLHCVESFGPIVFKQQKQQHAEPILLQLSFLSVVHALRETRFAFNVAAQTISIDCLNHPEKCCGFDFLPSHSEEDCDFSKVFQPFLGSSDKRHMYLLFKLLMQKLKEWWTVQEDTDQAAKFFRPALTFILSVILSQSCSFSSWSMNVNSIDDSSYNIALWTEFLQGLPFLSSSLSKKELVALSSCFVEILCGKDKISSGSTVTVHAVILKFIQSDFFVESKDFQTAFITALWKFGTSNLCSRKRTADENEEGEEKVVVCYAEKVFKELSSFTRKWAKQADSTPKTKQQNISGAWDKVETACDMLNEGLSDMSHFPCKVRANETLQFIQVMKYLPLEYLMPSNQMRCLVGSSAILFLLGNSCYNSNNTAKELLDELCGVMVSIFEGVRSVWLFEFVDVSPYMAAVVTALKKLKCQVNLSNFGVDGGEIGPEKFLFHLSTLATWNVEKLLSLENFIMQISNEIDDCPVSALLFLCIFHHLAQLLNRSYLKEDFKENCERLTAHLCSNLDKCLKHHKSDGKKISALHLGCYSELITVVSNSNCSFDADQKVVWLKHLPKLIDTLLEAIEDAEHLSEVESYTVFLSRVLAFKEELKSCIPDTVCLKSWRTYLAYLSKRMLKLEKELRQCSYSQKAEMEMNFMKMSSDVHYLCYRYSECATAKQGSNEEISQNLTLSHRTSPALKLLDSEYNMLICIAENCSDEEFKIIIDELSKTMDELSWSADVINVAIYILMLETIKSIISTPLEKTRVDMVSKIVQKVLMKVNFLLDRTCLLQRCFFYITSPSLNFISTVLKTDTIHMPKPCVVQCLHACLPVKLDQYSKKPALYPKAFSLIWEILNECLRRHTYVFVAARPAFIPYITMLLKSMIRAGDQCCISKCDVALQHEMEVCAQNLDKLFTSISKHEKEFAKMVPFIISEYVDAVQHVNVNPSIKNHIISGINRLLDICSEESLKMLGANINHSCREIYGNLVQNYKQLRYTGHV